MCDQPQIKLCSPDAARLNVGRRGARGRGDLYGRRGAHKPQAASRTSSRLQSGIVCAQDVLLFTDAISHGSAKRVNPGNRRVLVHRYGPAWGNFRIGASRVSPTRQTARLLNAGLSECARRIQSSDRPCAVWAGYQPSEELLERLTLRRRRIVHPLQARLSLPPSRCCPSASAATAHFLPPAAQLRTLLRNCATVPDGRLRAQNDLAVRPEPSRQLKQ